ncbi:hypothetical protein Sa4125_27720 [Aureimonas sp. SA4125]|uniref:hypothetical protein n=1 Tax=Aureimonas sp. SA4125 TaxID=2826993 RepID=UPI001CC8293D|nr:hypothetical protein [Aureimonas sp. SA4125]BDA85230.1 hypothetical protein Sa4125_27720 [Aureimonas sp. SA4125]
MASVGTHKHSDYLSRRRAESREYWLIFCVAYLPMLLTTIAGRLGGLAGHRRRDETGPRRSVFAEARAATAACIPFAFM